MSVSVLIADDHPIFRRGLREILGLTADFAVVAEAGDGEQAVRLIREHQPRLALLDVSMPQMDGLSVLEQVQRWPDAPDCVILTMHDERAYFNRAFRLGARGYLLKEQAEEELERCLRAVMSGQRYVGHDIRWTLDELGDPRAQSPLAGLTAAERRVLDLVADYHSSREIADLLNISIRTVDNHRAHILRKLGLRGSHALLRFAREQRDALPRAD